MSRLSFSDRTDRNRKNQVRRRLNLKDAEFRRSPLFRYIRTQIDDSPTLEEVLRIASKIPGSLSAEVIAERKKGRG